MLLIGDDEVAKGVATVRDMTGSAQEQIEAAKVVAYIREKIDG